MSRDENKSALFQLSNYPIIHRNRTTVHPRSQGFLPSHTDWAPALSEKKQPPGLEDWDCPLQNKNLRMKQNIENIKEINT